MEQPITIIESQIYNSPLTTTVNCNNCKNLISVIINNNILFDPNAFLCVTCNNISCIQKDFSNISNKIFFT